MERFECYFKNEKGRWVFLGNYPILRKVTRENRKYWFACDGDAQYKYKKPVAEDPHANIKINKVILPFVTGEVTGYLLQDNSKGEAYILTGGEWVNACGKRHFTGSEVIAYSKRERIINKYKKWKGEV